MSAKGRTMTSKITRRVVSDDEPGAAQHSLLGESCIGRPVDTPPSNENPADGTVNADGAVWGEGGWHKAEVKSFYVRRYEAEQAICSCRWEGDVHLLGHSYPPAVEDAEHHTWVVSHR